jgi:hypothetical protein
VVVSENQRRRVMQHGLSQDLARVNASAVDSPAEQLLESNEAMAVVEV